MKILHFADLHLGVETYGRPDQDGLSSRLQDFCRTFDRLIDFAIGEGVDLVLFCGDAYKTREPTQTQQREFARRIERLASRDIPVFLLTGNHDLPNTVGRATATEIFDTLAVRNVHVAGKPGIYPIQTRHGIVQILALPWLRRSALMARDEFKNLSLEELRQKAQEVLAGIISQNISRLDPGLPSLMAAHVWVAQAQVGSERSMAIGQEPALLLSNIARPAFDYVALGHIHRRQELALEPPVVYSGSLERLDFSDEGEEKGFYIVDIAESGGKRHVIFRFQPLEVRRFLTIEIDLDSNDIDPTMSALSAIGSRAEVKDAIVRVNIRLPAVLEGLLRDSALREALKDAHYFTIAREVRRENRPRLGQAGVEGMSPLDALRLYLDVKKVSPEHARELLEHGETLIKGAD